ncbi:MAG: DUF1887 family CARF protein [Defluviicoccus sp.]
MGTVYVCCGGENQVTNLQALRHYGIRQFSDVLMLIGCSDPPTAEDQRKAIEPAKHFRKLITQEAEDLQHQLAIKFIQAPRDDAHRWATELQTELGRIGLGHYLFNVTSGTRSMIFGALAALQEAGAEDPGVTVEAIVYLAQPPRLQLLHPNIDTREILIDPNDRVTFSDWIRLRGIYEQNRPAREARERNAIDRAALTAALLAFLQDFAKTANPRQPDRAFSDAVAALHGTAQPFLDEKAPKTDQPWVRRVFSDSEKYQKQILATMISRIDDRRLSSLLKKEGNDFVFSNEDGFRYLGGGWFEELVFLHCRERLGQRPTAWNDVHLSIRVQLNAQRRDLDADLDVIVIVDGQPHLIECKAKRFGGGVTTDDVQKLARWHHAVLGPRGRILLLSLQPISSGHDRLSREARLNQVDLVEGPDALSGLDRWLAGL